MMSGSDRIRCVSRVMRYICLFVIWIIPVIVFAIWFSTDDWLVELAHVNSNYITITFKTRVLGYLVSMISSVIVIYGLVQLQQLFRLYSEGQIFGTENIIKLLKFAYSLFAYGIVNPIVGALLSVILTINNPPGKKQLVLGVGSEDLTILFIATLFLVIAWVMAEGHELSKENAQIV